MQKIKAIFFMIFFSFACLTLGFADETLTITTYYPSPNGSYNNLSANTLTVSNIKTGYEDTANKYDYIRLLSQYKDVPGAPDADHQNLFGGILYGSLGALNFIPGSFTIFTYYSNPLVLDARNAYILLNPYGGNVGIGTTTRPSKNLVIEGNAFDSSDLSFPGIIVRNTNTVVNNDPATNFAGYTAEAGNGTVKVVLSASANAATTPYGTSARLWTTTNHSLILGSNNLDVLKIGTEEPGSYISGTQYVNLGIDTAGGYIEGASSQAGTNRIRIQSSSRNGAAAYHGIMIGEGAIGGAAGTSGSNGITFYTGGAFNNRMVIDDAGRVGIGTTTPQGALDVNSTTAAFIPPRVTTTQEIGISNPVAGSVIYNTSNNRLEVYNGSAWVGAGTSVSRPTYMDADNWGGIVGATLQAAFSDCETNGKHLPTVDELSYIAAMNPSLKPGVTLWTITPYVQDPNSYLIATMNGDGTITLFSNPKFGGRANYRCIN